MYLTCELIHECYNIDIKEFYSEKLDQNQIYNYNETMDKFSVLFSMLLHVLHCHVDTVLSSNEMIQLTK